MNGTRTTARFHVLSECEVDGVKIMPGEYEGEKRQSSTGGIGKQTPQSQFFIWVGDRLPDVSHLIGTAIKVLTPE